MVRRRLYQWAMLVAHWWRICLRTGRAGDVGSIPGLGRSPGGGLGHVLQYSSLENHMDRGAWRAMVYGVAKSRTWLSTYTHTGYTRGYLPTKKGIRKAGEVIEQEPRLTVSIYGEVCDFCQGITHSRPTPFLASKSKLETYMVWRQFSCVGSSSGALG